MYDTLGWHLTVKFSYQIPWKLVSLFKTSKVGYINDLYRLGLMSFLYKSNIFLTVEFSVPRYLKLSLPKRYYNKNFVWILYLSHAGCKCGSSYASWIISYQVLQADKNKLGSYPYISPMFPLPTSHNFQNFLHLFVPKHVKFLTYNFNIWGSCIQWVNSFTLLAKLPPGRVLPVPLAKSWTKYGDKRKASARWKSNPSYPVPKSLY